MIPYGLGLHLLPEFLVKETFQFFKPTPFMLSMKTLHRPVIVHRIIDAVFDTLELNPGIPVETVARLHGIPLTVVQGWLSYYASTFA